MFSSATAAGVGLGWVEFDAQFPDALHELELRHGHGHVQNTAGDPALVLAVHQPDELALVGVGRVGTDRLGTGAVPGPRKQIGREKK